MNLASMCVEGRRRDIGLVFTPSPRRGSPSMPSTITPTPSSQSEASELDAVPAPPLLEREPGRLDGPRIAFLITRVDGAVTMRSLSRQLLMIGTQSASSSCKASQAVSMARESQACIHSIHGKPVRAQQLARALRLGDAFFAKDASSQPVNNPNLLCSVRPWRRMTIASLAANAAGWHVDGFGILVTTRSAGRPMYRASTAG